MKQIIALIAAGNSTLYIWDCPEMNRAKMINKYLGKIEQIGFVDSYNSYVYLTMMGDELCINGILGLSKLIKNTQQYFATGLSKPIQFSNQNNDTSICIDLPYQQISNEIIFKGIAYEITENKYNLQQEYFRQKIRKYNVPAFGVINYTNNIIFPYVYVSNTNSLIAETACGSGSVAFSILKNISKIIQPSGESIEVIRLNSTKFRITAKVTLKGGELI